MQIKLNLTLKDIIRLQTFVTQHNDGYRHRVPKDLFASVESSMKILTMSLQKEYDHRQETQNKLSPSIYDPLLREDHNELVFFFQEKLIVVTQGEISTEYETHAGFKARQAIIGYLNMNIDEGAGMSSNMYLMNPTVHQLHRRLLYNHSIYSEKIYAKTREDCYNLALVYNSTSDQNTLASQYCFLSQVFNIKAYCQGQYLEDMDGIRKLAEISSA